MLLKTKSSPSSQLSLVAAFSTLDIPWLKKLTSIKIYLLYFCLFGIYANPFTRYYLNLFSQYLRLHPFFENWYILGFIYKQINYPDMFPLGEK